MKKNILFVLMLVFILFFGTSVDAAKKKNCDQQVLKPIKELASQVTVNYELVTYMDTYGDYSRVPDGGNIQDYYYNIIIDNMSEEIYVDFGPYTKYYKDSKDGKLVVESAFKGGAKLSINIYSATGGDCKDTLIKTIVLKLPYYNIYSIYPECEGNVGKLKICSPDIDTSKYLDDDFRRIVKQEEEEYNKKQEQEEEHNKNEKWYIKIINWYKDNKKLTIPATIAVVLLILLIVIKVKLDNKSKVKVDLGDI